MGKLLELFETVKPSGTVKSIDEGTLQYFLSEIEKNLSPDKKREAEEAATTADWDKFEAIVSSADVTLYVKEEEKKIEDVSERKKPSREFKIPEVDFTRTVESFDEILLHGRKMSETELSGKIYSFLSFIKMKLGEDAERKAVLSLEEVDGVKKLRGYVVRAVNVEKARKELERKSKETIEKSIALIRKHLGDSEAEKALELIKKGGRKASEEFGAIYSEARIKAGKVGRATEIVIQNMLGPEDYKKYQKLGKMAEEDKETSPEFGKLMSEVRSKMSTVSKILGSGPERGKKRDFEKPHRVEVISKKIEAVTLEERKKFHEEQFVRSRSMKVKGRKTKERKRRKARKRKPISRQIKDYVDLWLERMRFESIESKRDKTGTIGEYGRALAIFSEWLGERKFNELKPSDGVKYIDWMISRKYKSRTMQVKISAVSSFYKFIVSRDIAPINPFETIKVPAAEELKPKPITAEMDFVFLNLNDVLRESLNPGADLLVYDRTDIPKLWTDYNLGFMELKEYMVALKEIIKLKMPRGFTRYDTMEDRQKFRGIVRKYYDKLKEAKKVVPFDSSHWNAMLLMRFAGLRISEVFSLNIKDIKVGSLDSTIIRVEKGKGSKARNTIFVPYFDKDGIPSSRYEEAFQRYYTTRSKSNKPLFPLGKWSLRGYVIKLKKIGVFDKSFTFHRLRHTFATILINVGYDYEIVAEFLGHQSTKTTRVYGRRTADTLEKMFLDRTKEILSKKGIEVKTREI